MWLLPSRGRPLNLARFFQVCRATGISTPGVVLIDRDDYGERQAAYEALELPLGWRIRQTAGPRQGEKTREVWDEVKDCAWLGLIGDDNVPQTLGWDRLLVEKLDGWNIVSCNDQWQAPRRVGNCWIIGGPLARAVGYIFAPGMEHLFVDDLWEAIGREGACLTCRMDVVVRHVHVFKGDAPVDETHKAVYGDGFVPGRWAPDRAKGLWASDEAAFKAWLVDEKPRILELIRATRSRPTPEHQARMERAKTRSVMILTPCHEKPAWQYTLSLADTLVSLARLGIRATVEFVVGNSNLPRARNELAAVFLASDYSDAILIDDDMGWKLNDIVRLLASDKPVIGAVGRKKVDKPISDPSIWCVRLIPGTRDNLRQDEMGAVEVAGVGTGCLKIERGVFGRLVAEHPEWKRRGHDAMTPAIREKYHKFFRFADDEHDTGEDYQFCNDWRALGGEVWIDPSIGLIHAGLHGFTGCFGDVLVPADQAVVPLKEQTA